MLYHALVVQYHSSYCLRGRGRLSSCSESFKHYLLSVSLLHNLIARFSVAVVTQETEAPQFLRPQEYISLGTRTASKHFPLNDFKHCSTLLQFTSHVGLPRPTKKHNSNVEHASFFSGQVITTQYQLELILVKILMAEFKKMCQVYQGGPSKNVSGA